MRAMKSAVIGFALSALGCRAASEAPMPQLTEAARAAAKDVTVAGLQVSERALTAKAQRGEAAVALTLTPGEPIPWSDRLLSMAMGMWEPERDGGRPCTILLIDRDGELLREDGATVGVTDTRSLEDFEADLNVAEGLAALLSQNQQAWNLYRWELRDVERTAHELQGLRGPTQ